MKSENGLVTHTFRNLQIETYSLPVNENAACVEKLLSGAIEFLVAAESGKREEEFDRLAASARLVLAG